MTNLFDENNNNPATPESNVPRSNVPEFSVSELAFSLKRTLEDTYGRVRIRGEIGRVTIPRSGHLYTNLKDDQSSIDAICWKGVLSKLSIKPEEGMEVICTGKITTYPARSNYQLVIETMELAGEGALLKLLEERKKKLGAEGLFAPERKQPIPFLPRKIGVVTSQTGAVIRDILHRLNDRFPRHVVVWPVLVQGSGAAEQVAAAIRGFDALPADQKPDTLIVARGGGSLEDLMPFNEEIVVRAIAECSIPTISAVGHETDTTLADYAADLRAPTPTGAAEMAVPVRENLIAQVMDNQKRLFHAWVRLGSEYKHRLDAAAAKLGDPSRLLETQIQRLDHAESRLSSGYNAFLNAKHNTLIENAGRLTHPRHIIEQSVQRLESHTHRLQQAGLSALDKKRTALGEHTARLVTPAHMIKQSEQALTSQSNQLSRIGRTLFDTPQQSLKTASRMLETLSYTRTLERGYVVVRDEQGHVINRADNITAGQNLDLEFFEGQHIKASITDNGTSLTAAPSRGAGQDNGKNQNQPKTKEKKNKSNNETGQKSLF